MDDALRYLIKQYLKPKGCNEFPSVPTKESQLNIIAHNWDKAKKHLCDMVVNSEVFYYDIGDCFDLLKKRGAMLTNVEAESVYSALLEQNKFYETVVLSGGIGVSPSNQQQSMLNMALFCGKWKLPYYEKESDIPEYLRKPKLTQEQVDAIGKEWLASLAVGVTEKDRLQDITRLISLTGLTPRWDMDLAQLAYDKIMDEDWFLEYDMPYINFFKDVIGISNDEKFNNKLQRYCTKMLKEYKFSLNELEGLINKTQIRPERSAVETLYRESLNVFNLSELKRIAEITGVKIDKGHIQNAYLRYLGDGQVAEINLLRNATKIEPKFSLEDVQKVYANLLEHGRVGAAINVYLFTDIDPVVDHDIAVKACESLIAPSERRGGFYMVEKQIQWLCFYFKDDITSTLQDYIGKLAATEHFILADEVANRLCIEPKPEDRYAIACFNGEWDSARETYYMFKERIDDKYPILAGLVDYFQAIQKPF